MTVEEIIIASNFIMNFIFGIIAIYYAKKVHDMDKINTALNKENMRLNRINTELNKLALAPSLNIILNDIFAPSREKNMCMKVTVDNVGNGKASFPKCCWNIILENGEKENSSWLDFPFFGDVSFTELKSFIAPGESISTVYPLNLPKEKLGEPFKNVKIWLEYKDIRNIEWRSYAEFGWDKKGHQTKIVEKKVYIVSRPR